MAARIWNTASVPKLRCFRAYLEGQSVDDHVGPQLGAAAGLRGSHRQRELLVEHLQQLLRPDGLLKHPHAEVRLVLHHLEWRCEQL